MKSKPQEPGHLQADIAWMTIDDPGYQPEHHGTKGNNRYSKAPINMNESPILWLYSHNWIDQAQFKAGSRISRLYQALGSGGFSSIDHTRDVVDGGAAKIAIPDSKIDAGRQLHECQLHIGAHLYDIVSKICGEGIMIKQLAQSEWARRRISKQLKEGLDLLSQRWGYTT